jgi:dTMP kinase
MTSRFITFEGIDGAGKSTHVEPLAARLRAQGADLICTREPGGTPLAERLRELLLREPMDGMAEALLAFAARRDHIERVIAPALAKGQVVLCDRFTDATFAYQGGGHGVPRERICELENFIPARCRPELTILFDVPIEVSRERLERGVAKGRDLDKFEREEFAFFERVRNVYLERAAHEPARFRVVNAARPLDDVRADLTRVFEAF